MKSPVTACDRVCSWWWPRSAQVYLGSITDARSRCSLEKDIRKTVACFCVLFVSFWRASLKVIAEPENGCLCGLSQLASAGINCCVQLSRASAGHGDSW